MHINKWLQKTHVFWNVMLSWSADLTENALQSFKMLEPTQLKPQCYFPTLNHQEPQCRYFKSQK
jgi:hypothetical protein